MINSDVSELSFTVDIHEPKWLAQRLGVKEQVHIGYCDILIEKDGETWGIERKTWTDALNSWMNKRLEKQLSKLVGVVDHAFLLIQHEPEKRLQKGAANTYEQFKKHTPNLNTHLNRMCAEVCPVIYCDDSAVAIKEILKLKDRVQNESFGSMTVYEHNIRHADPTIQFLMAIPRVGKARATFIKERFVSLQDFVERPQELENMIRNTNDVKAIQKFLKQDWTVDDI